MGLSLAASCLLYLLTIVPPKHTLLQVQDASGHVLHFHAEERQRLALTVQGQRFCKQIETLSYRTQNGEVTLEGVDDEDDQVEGTFELVPQSRLVQASQLQVLCEQAVIQWLGDDPLRLPQEVEALLIDEEMRASRSRVRLLWANLLEVYESEELALEAVRKNSVIVLPFLNKPRHISGSWSVLKEKLGESEARDVIEKNPGVLSCNPLLLREQSKLSVVATARAVDVVNGVSSLLSGASPA